MILDRKYIVITIVSRLRALKIVLRFKPLLIVITVAVSEFRFSLLRRCRARLDRKRGRKCCRLSKETFIHTYIFIHTRL